MRMQVWKDGDGMADDGGRISETTSLTVGSLTTGRGDTKTSTAGLPNPSDSRGTPGSFYRLCEGGRMGG